MNDIMRISVWLSVMETVTSAVLLSSCGGRTSGVTADVDSVDIRMDSVRIDASSVEGSLPSYGGFSTVDSKGVLSAYNYRTHAIDRYDTADGVALQSIALQQDGPDGIPGRIVAFRQEADSLYMIYDRICLYRVNGDGKVVERHPLVSGEFAILGMNARANDASLYISEKDRTVSYPVVADDNLEVITQNLADDTEISRLKLGKVKDSENFGFMRYPNVTVTDSLVIVNYPFEAAFTVTNRDTSASTLIEDKSAYSIDKAQESADDSLEGMTLHGMANPHYFALQPISNGDRYVQFYLTGVENSTMEGIERAMYERDLCLKLFDSSFNKIGEWKLDHGRYDPYMGWTIAGDRVLLFEDNLLNPIQPEDSLTITLLSFP